MFGKKIKLFKFLGFQVSVDLSWIIIAVLVAWSLSAGFFPYYYKDLPQRIYWIMGITGAIGLFASVIVHEFCHSLMSRRYGLEMKGITLFIFGGVAEMVDEPPSPRAEFWIAAVGPLSSIAMALIFYGIQIAGQTAGWPGPLNAVIGYLAMINLILAIFNLIPAFPLDGGRILRSILWGIKKDLRWSTRISSAIGSGFGIFLIILGVLNVLSGNFVGGMWYFLIGMFLQGAAKMSYQQLMTRKALEGEHVRDFMNTDPVTISPALSLQEVVEDYMYHFDYKFYPVVEDNAGAPRLQGCITTREIKNTPREKWGELKVADVISRCGPENTIAPDADAMEAMAKMNRHSLSRLMVVEGTELLGVIALKDMLRFLSRKVELER